MDRILIEQRDRRYYIRPLGYIDNLYQRLGGIVGLGYDKARRSWTAPLNDETLRVLERIFGKEGVVFKAEPSTPKPVKRLATVADAPKAVHISNKSAALPTHWANAYHRCEEQLKVLRYSWRTIKSYLSHLYAFLAAHPKHELKDINNEIVRTYLVSRAAAGNYSESTQGQMLNAIKFWLERVEGRERAFIDLYPKKKKALPTVLSMGEVKRLLAVVINLKHRCILKMIYGSGLRLSELTNLRIADIHPDRMQVFVHGGKGKKDRYTTLSKSTLEELKVYQVEYQPSYWLFEGQSGGQYSVRSVQKVLRKAVADSGVNPFCTVHTLRHSYATHLLEGGTSLRHIQELLGHASSLTTEIYTHVSNKEKQRIISPLDNL
jgi:site-specific recombinase XerD